MKNNILFLIILMIIAFHINAQNITSTIVDAQSGTILIGANVQPDQGQGTITDYNGMFELPLGNSTYITVSYIGYEKLTMNIHEVPSFIRLSQASHQLNQIIVSADRDKRERKEIPIAVSLIPQKIIEETQPVAMSELLNKISGVNMIELGNEQHSMAIRQPISYKSVFLYLEDGIPIRPTGVFNHNALIEINMNSLRSIEVIRGAYSSLYGSDAIGGAINFITKDPSAYPMAKFSLQGNNIGFGKVKLDASNSFGKSSFSLSGDYAFRKNGVRAHSDYNKLALTIKYNNQLSDKTRINNSVSYLDYKTDMTGGLDSAYFFNQDFTSQQTFTYREVKALRFSSKLSHYWNDKHKTNIIGFYRNNLVGQNPHYRIKDDFKPWSQNGDKNLAHSEINEDKFYSIGGILHQSYDLGMLEAKISGGLSVDYSPNTYLANYIKVHKNDNKIYDSYEKTDSILTDYEVDLLNTGAYLQAEFNPFKALKISGAIRFDNFKYNYRNNLGQDAYSGAPDSKDNFSAITPRIGATYDFGRNIGIYTNYSRGFSPPEVSELYRGVKVPSLEPTDFNNYEVGTWISLFENKLSFDISYYELIGKNEIISVKLDNGSTAKQNAGSTSHKGIEYNVNVQPITDVNIRFSGAYSKHEFTDYIEKSNDYSGNEMPGAPGLIANSELVYRPKSIPNLSVGLEWQHIDNYYMDPANKKEYSGHNLLNLRFGYKYNNIVLWTHVLNITDELYATSASSSRWGDSYRIGDPRVYNIGISYTLK